MDCTRYYDKVFTYSDINFFKAATDTMYFIFSNNTQTILARGLGTCQEGNKKNKISFLRRKLYQAASIFKTMAPVIEEPHTVLLETTLKSKVPKTTLNVALNNNVTLLNSS